MFSGTDLQLAFASGYTEDYTELTDERLDELSARTTESNTAPQITVFTHGYGGNAGHWSNDISAGGEGKFAYESDSMIEQLHESIEANDKQVTMFVAQVAGVNEATTTIQESQSEILDTALTANVGSEQLRCMYNGGEYITTNEVKLYNIDNDYNLTNKQANKYITSNDVSKHIILVFNAEQSERSNDYVYAQLEYILDSISYQYRQLTGELPTYNLIAHSRGGITNMQYALAHPYNVASLYSIGTPYNGSAFGSAEIGDSNVFLGLAQIHKSDSYYSDGTNDYPPGVLDIINFNLTESYKSFWNTYYNEWYSHIKFRPIGSYVTVGFVLQTLAEVLAEEFSVDEDILRGIAGVIEVAGYAAETALIAEHLAVAALVAVIDEVIDLIVDKIPNASPWVKILKNISIGSVPYDHLGGSMYGVLVYEDDLFIDLNSQIAYG